MTKTVDINCPISILKQLHTEINLQDWADDTAKQRVASGVILAVGRLEKHGFIEVSKEELAIRPLPVIDQNQLSFL